LGILFVFLFLVFLFLLQHRTGRAIAEKPA